MGETGTRGDVQCSIKKCEWCKARLRKPTSMAPSRFAVVRYCQECARRRPWLRSAIGPKPCSVCGSAIRIKPSESTGAFRRRKHCSRRCGYKSRRCGLLEKTCEWCGKPMPLEEGGRVSPYRLKRMHADCAIDARRKRWRLDGIDLTIQQLSRIANVNETTMKSRLAVRTPESAISMRLYEKSKSKR